MQRSYILGAGILFRAVMTTPMERTHGKERNMSQPDTDTAAQSPSSQQEPQIQTDGRRSHSEQVNQPAQTSQSESSHDGKDEHALHTNLKRGMESRHLQMISLGGVIGTGLFLSSGYTIQQANRTVGKDIYLVGVDALTEAVQDVLDGNMTGTVLNDDVGQATKAAEATKLFVEGKDVEQFYWVDYVKVTKDNASQYIK